MVSRLTGFLRARIGAKILGPYLLLMFLVTVLGTIVVLHLVTGSLEQRFTNQLLDAGKNVNDDVIRVEREQVELIRLMANTDGVDQAVGGDNAQTLQRLLVPLQANSQYSFVDIVDAGGREVLALRPRTGPLSSAVDPSVNTWTLTQAVLRNQRDDYGNKFSEIVHASFGDMFYTAGPVVDPGGDVVGAILVGLPVGDLLKRLTADVLANVTVYGADGSIVQSTLSLSARERGDMSLKKDEYAAVTRQGMVLQRSIRAGGQDYLEVVGGVFVRDSIQAGLGVAIPKSFIAQSSERTRWQMTLLFSAVVIGVILIGSVLARRITSPILALVNACQAVATGNLTARVAITARDETGILASTFNEMVNGLKERDFIRDTFGRYMTREVSEAILKQGGVKLGGERRMVTMLMSDIRGFTTLSETMTPEDLVAFLNRYFKRMVDCIDQYEGVVDKFMGDAILVKFGAPVERKDHARRALLTALAMRQHLVAFNEELIAAGHQPIRIGIGINTGPVIVGNIGAESRMEYTVIGDTVNATQRTEDLTKDFKTDILLTETTRAELGDDFEFAAPYYVTLRGRAAQTAIFPVLGLRDGVQELLGDSGPILIDAVDDRQSLADEELMRAQM